MRLTGIKFCQSYFFLLAGMLLCHGVFAQHQIQGVVKDSSGLSVEYANVVVQTGSEKTFVNGTSCDENGQFSLDVKKAGEYELLISFIGFNDWTKVVNIDGSVDLGEILLSSAISSLDEVTVTASRGIIEKKENAVVFNVDRSPLKTGFDGIELLRRSPNVIFGAEGEILIRNQVATVLINGRVSNLSGEDLLNFIRNLRSEDIKAIEIQTNTSVNIDAQGAGGAINIILKQKPTGFNGSARTYYHYAGEGYNMPHVGINLNYGAEKWNIYGAYDFTEINVGGPLRRGIEYFNAERLLLTDIISETTNRDHHNYRLGFVADIATNHVVGLEVFGSDIISPFDEFGAIDVFDRGLIVEAGALDLNTIENTALYNTTFNYTWTTDTLGSQLKVFLDYANQDVTNDNTIESVYTMGEFENETSQNNSTANSEIFSAQTDLEQNFSSGLKMKAGLKYTYTDRANTLASATLVAGEWIDNDRSSAFDYIERISAGYLSFSRQLGEKNYLEVGLRVENTDLEKIDLVESNNIEQNYTDWFPSAFFSRNLPNDHSLSASYSRRLTRPSFQLLNNNIIVVNDFRYFVGNPDLRPEYLNSFELSYKRKKQIVNVYYRYVEDVIAGFHTLDDDDIIVSQYLNAGNRNEFGLEYNWFGNINKWWFFKFAATGFNRSFVDGEDNEVFDIISANVNVSNNIKLNETTTIDISGYYIAPFNDNYYKQFGFGSVDLLFQKTFMANNLTLRVYVNDVFNVLEYANESVFNLFERSFWHKPQTQNIRIWVGYNFF